MIQKTCRKCLKDFPATTEFFYRNSGGKFGLTPRCKLCVNQDNADSHAKRLAANPDAIRAMVNARSKKSYHRHLERNREKQRKHQAKKRSDPEKRAHINMAKRAGGARLKPDDFNRLFAAQGCKCAICSTTEPGSKNGWNIDHCHKSGQVRFILCAHCNRGLGAFFDNPALMRKAANILEQYQHQADEPVASIFT